MREIPLEKFRSGTSIFLSPAAIQRLFNCEWCLGATMDVAIYHNQIDSIVLCRKCSTRYETTVTEFLLGEHSRVWLEDELLTAVEQNVIRFPRERVRAIK